MSSIPTTTFADKQVGRMGFGLMQLTWGLNCPSEEDSFAAMKAAADAGALAWSTATFYGPPENPQANPELIGKFFKKYPEYKDKVVVVLKGGLGERLAPVHDIDLYRSEIEVANKLIGRPVDVYSLARLPTDSAVEDIFGTLKALKEQGLFKEVGASEMSRQSLERAHTIVPISVIEIEVSLWSYAAEIREVVDWAQQAHVQVFAYSPLGRGFLTRKWQKPEDIPQGEFAGMVPKFQGQAFYNNMKLVDAIDEIAEARGLQSSQLALAWLVGLHGYMLPIPGTSNPKRAKENTEAAGITLTAEDKAAISHALETFQIEGARYPDFLVPHLMK